tara:strand:- start:1327 stop:2679 length:1353 start_codon:yes stop_codon:yes gene_type:complete
MTLKVEIENPTNACVAIKTDQGKILIDPWLDDGIYDGTWHNFPRVTDDHKSELLKDVSLCLITHLHKDHFNIATIKRLPRETKIVFVKTFGWQVIKATLESEGFNNLILLNVDEQEYLIDELGFKISPVPPINTSGLYSQADQNDMSIDAGFVIESNISKLKLVFLADNNLYNTEIIKKNLSLLKDPDLIAFAYSGFASDYPFNYQYSREEQLNICEKLEKSRFDTQVKNLKIINPKTILPYSSEFVAVGPTVEDWTNALLQTYTSDKVEVGRRYADAIGCNFETLYPNELLVAEGRKFLPVTEVVQRSNLMNELLEYQKSISCKNFKNNSDETIIIDDFLLEESAKNCFTGVIKNNLKPNLAINIYSDNNFLGALDFKQSHFNKSNPIKDSYLNIYIAGEMLHRVLKRSFHWDDACLSLKVKWERHPEPFDIDTQNALTYFCQPIMRSS